MSDSQQPRRRREIKSRESIPEQQRRQRQQNRPETGQPEGTQQEPARPRPRPAAAPPRAERSQRRPTDTAAAKRAAAQRQMRRQNPTAPPPESTPELTTAPVWLAVSRAVSFFLGSFVLLNLFGELRSPGFDANVWWLELRPLPEQVAKGFLAFTGVGMVLYACRPRLPVLIKTLVTLTLLISAGFAVYNSLFYYKLINAGEISTSFPVAFSIHVVAMLLVILVGVISSPKHSSGSARDFAIGLFTFILCLIAFPIAQMYCFGKTDYRRNADVILVFGCRAHADGSPSDALRDRMTTANKLYQDGLASTMVLSGGPGDGDFHETAVMKQLALEQGVPESAILLDEQGWNTAETINNLPPLIENLPGQNVLAVSHFYHLPRIKMTSRRKGLTCFTVPAEESKILARQPWFLLREVAALWWYYLEPLGQR